MAKTKPKRKSRGFPPADSSTSATTAKPAHSEQRPMRWGLIALFLTISIGGSYLAIWMRPKGQDAERFSYEVTKTYPHDPTAFTQGLVYENGFLWESTGRLGQSSVRKTKLETGEILQKVDLDEDMFGEGLALLDDQLFQLTWKNERAFVYDRELKQVEEFKYDGQGWGLATNGTELIFSDGSAVIKFLDPKTFKELRSIRVMRPGGIRVGQLNELEYFKGRIFANNYLTDIIYEIDPDTGDVTKIIDLSGLWPSSERPPDGILNGIAVNTSAKPPSLLVTGKLCPKVWELRLFPESSVSR